MDRKGIKIAFIEPAGSQANIFSNFMNMPLLGPVYLGTIAKNAGYDVVILNENILKRSVLDEEIEEVDILCISCITATITKGKKIASHYKDLRKTRNLNSRTIIGGIHASMLPDDVKNDFDQVFIGEAETKILQILSGEIEDKIIYGEKLKNLNDIPTPDFSLIKGWRAIKTWPIMTSRGCPYNCNFCSVTNMFGKEYRMRSETNIINELKLYRKKNVFFVDDNFIVNYKHTNAVLDSMLENKIKCVWSAQLRTNVSKNQALINKMKKTGCKTVFIGLESINPDSLKEMRKSQTVEDVKTAISVFRKNAIFVHGMFVFGSDSDDKNILKATAKFCLKSDLSSVQYLILTPLPGTELFSKLEKEKRLLHVNWEYFDTMHIVFKPLQMSPYELQQSMVKAFKRFYSVSGALNEFFIYATYLPIALLKKIVVKSYLPSIMPFFIKLMGKKIIKKWNEANSTYLYNLKKSHDMGC